MLQSLRARRARAEIVRRLDGHEPPSFSASSLRVLAKLRDPEVSFDEVAEAIQWDPGLSVRLLQTVNSAAFASRVPIAEVKHAVSYLGRGPLESLVLAVAARGALPEPVVRGFDPGRFWCAAARRAALARALASRLHPALEGESFTAALLLDLAVPLKAAALGEAYGATLEEWHASPCSSLESVERAHLESTHCEVGALLATAWDLPGTLATAIARHHDGATSDDEVPPALRLVAGMPEVDCPDAEEQLVEAAREGYGLDPDWVRGVLADSLQQAFDLESAA